jgi:hypothetical protein
MDINLFAATNTIEAARPRHDPLTLRADLPPSTSDVVVRLLAKSPDRRPSDAAAFLKEIGRIEGELEAVDRTAAMTGLRPAPAAEPTVRTESPAAARPAPAAVRQSGPYVLAAAALLAAVVIFAWVWRSATSRTVLPAAPRVTPMPVAAAPALRTEVPIPTPASLPTRGPEEAAAAIVGATRIVTPGQPPARRAAPASTSKRMASAPEAAGRPEPPAPPAPPPPVEAPSETFSPDNVYRTRRYAKFSVSPDQARLYLTESTSGWPTGTTRRRPDA